MAKRIADKVLTDRNWDQEDEAEEAGTFSLASEDVLKSRAIKKAKRRNAGKEADSGGAFKGFKGFSLTPSAPAAGGSFGGFGNLAGFSSLTSSTKDSTASVTTSCGGFSSPATNKDPVTGSLSFNGGASSSFSSFSKPTCGSDVTQNGSASSPAIGSDSGKNSSSSISSEEYDGQVIALNCSVRDWIIKHVNDNPLCDLNPIFRDYELHLASIVKKYGSGAAEQENAGAKPESGGEEKRGLQAIVSTAATTPSCSSSSSSSTGTVTPVKSSVPTGVTFNFGQKVDSSVLGSLASVSSSGFSFTTSSSSSSSTSLFGGAASNTQTADQNGADEESEEPPVPVVKEIKEKDAFYSKKCKLFYKKESEFKEKGVGTLHLKMVSEGKLQLLVRADTNLGNILLNIMVTSTMPCSRTGKNNVMVVCVPNPAVDVKNPATPVPMLIRVKTAEDADELHKILQEKKA